MKIIKRLALENYCYEELHFDSLEEYEAEYPKYVATFKKVRNKINPPPFPDDKTILTEEEQKKIDDLDEGTYTEHYINLKRE